VCVCSFRYPSRNAHESYRHPSSARLYNIFPHYLINSTIFEKKLLKVNCVFCFLYGFYLKHFYFYEDVSSIWSKTYTGLHVVYPLILSDFNENWIFSTDFRKILKISTFMKIRPVGTELYHVDRRTDMTELRIAFRNFANAPIYGSYRRRWNRVNSASLTWTR
jgi:hypothetical protein